MMVHLARAFVSRWCRHCRDECEARPRARLLFRFVARYAHHVGSAMLNVLTAASCWYRFAWANSFSGEFFRTARKTRWSALLSREKRNRPCKISYICICVCVCMLRIFMAWNNKLNTHTHTQPWEINSNLYMSRLLKSQCRLNKFIVLWIPSRCVIQIGISIFSSGILSQII